MKYIAVITDRYGGPTRKILFLTAVSFDAAMTVAQSLATGQGLRVSVIQPQPSSLKSSDFKRAAKAFADERSNYEERGFLRGINSHCQ